MSVSAGENIEARIGGLSPAKRALLDRRLGNRTGPRKGPTRLTEGMGPWPTSFGQRDFWFLQRLEPDSASFNTTDAVRVRGPLDVEALTTAVQTLVERHQVLRTGLTVVDSEPMQVIRPAEDLKFPVTEVAGGGRGQLPLEVRRLIAAERDRPFDLESEVMYRVALIRLNTEDHVLVRTTHHIAFDKWSAGVANRELGEIYSALLSGRQPDLSLLPYQYADFSAWQRSPDNEDALLDDLAFFATHVAGVPQVFELPADYSRTVHHDSPGSRYTESVSSEVVEAARALARRQGATTFMVMLAAFGALLSRLGRQDQILIGVPVAGRTRPEFEVLIGLFINTLVLRLDLRDEPSFLELLSRVRAASLGATAHQNLPFDQLVRHTSKGRPRGRSPLFQVMFDYINTPGGALRLGGLDLESIPVGDDKSAFELTLFVIDDGAGMKMSWEYRTDLFERTTIRRFARSLQSVLREALADPEGAVKAVPLMTTSEREKILRTGCGPEGSLAGVPSPVSLFDSQVAERPHAIAVRDGGVDMSYLMLSEEATRIGDRLHLAGARPGDCVALVLERSWQLVAALLGVIRAGYVAVLLDPEQPSARLSAMLAQANAAIVVRRGVTQLPLPSTAITLEYDADPRSGSSANTASAFEVAADSPMYVVFTSGSTGSPKGVIVSHRSAANFAADTVDRYQITSIDRVLQFSSPGFDTMIEEIFGALGGGAVLVMRPPELFPTLAAFSEFVGREGITVLDLPTAWWSAWVDEMERTRSGVPASVRLVIVGGEAAGTDRWRAWRRIVSEQVRWVNTYGPAEAAVVVSTFEPYPGWPGPTGPTIPIGRPIANAQLAVIDETGEPLPIGVPGELCIGGTPVALGYLTGAGGSQSGFAPDPFHPGARMYRTGDLARLLADGNFEYLGRIDHQVKVRGIRVEPGEVEFVICQHPQIDRAVVVVGGGITDRRLVGHVVSVVANLNLGELANHLAKHLPRVMIPTSWAVHESLPYTLAGKVDRRALEEMAVATAAANSSGASEALSETERELLSLWGSVLNRPAMGANDDFFALGGHSLLGVRLIARVAESFGVELPLRAIFDASTVGEMARLIDVSLPGDTAPRA